MSALHSRQGSSHIPLRCSPTQPPAGSDPIPSSMNLSEEWRFLFPVSSVFAPPSLAVANRNENGNGNGYGPLLFSPLPPPATLHTNIPFPAFQFHPPHSKSTGDALRYFLSSTASFLPTPDLHSLSSSLSDSTTFRPPPPPSNLLATILLRAPSTSLLLFFPSGHNADHLSYATLHSTAAPLSAVQTLTHGFMHPGHRIHHLAATSSCPPPHSHSPAAATPLVHGFLLAATTYSVNWFKVESSSSSSTSPPALVPAAKQAFDAAVVHACWSKHLHSDCLVLLDNAHLCCFDLHQRRGSVLRVGTATATEGGACLSCDYGPQPWTAVVATTKAILLLDLRYGPDHPGNCKVLARVGMQGLFDPDPPLNSECHYLAFCKAPFDDFLMSVATERLLLVLDIRQPLTPVLAWQHGLHNPNHIAMFRLSQLRPSKEHEWASSSGIAILAGSFWSTGFNLFFCGPKDQCSSSSQNAHHLYAWDVPSRISLIGQHCSCSNGLMREVFTDHEPITRNTVVGYHVLPNTLLQDESSSSFTGFALIRLTSSGKLEMQRFRASGDFDEHVMCDGSHHQSAACTTSSIISPDTTAHGEKFSSRYKFLKFHYLSKYLEGNLLSALENHNVVNKGSHQIVISEDVSAFAKENSPPCYRSVSDLLCNASVPMNIFETGCQHILNNGLSSDSLLVTFSKYKDMLACSKGKLIYEYPEVPARSRNNDEHRPFLLAKPSGTGNKLTSEAISGDALVGPLLPIPLLLAIEDRNKGTIESSTCQGETSSVSRRCREALEACVPKTSNANATRFSGWYASRELRKKPYFVYEPQIDDRLTLDETARKEGKKAHMDENLTTFVCGKAGVPHSGPKQAASNLFDSNCSPVRMDFELPFVDVQPAEQKAIQSLKNQFLSWQNNFRPYKDFCNSHHIQLQKPQR
ncbi:Os09g0104700 [Oryza sativa Japonica Group]|uniref:Uncharacterized protein n=3 Tax=Oryza sativa subsp. japonica TaxID=39947 RepID=A0A0P0XIH1_ORYSJ|nr:hypothetical protein EE612_046052 [Oryza sativa]BAD33686.1 hypothetical protein [Oryza sativa Japonica Group]BAD34154.1 hypothetical protein [Oryza sativa Japonica Group]BAT06792.1 Os09g0104700 [Oryza sativa Japonica Group]